MEPVEVGSVTMAEHAKGAFKMVFDYIDELDRLGLYDSASIVITADHGEWPGYTETTPGNFLELYEPALTALFVKPAGAPRDLPLRHSEAPTEFANVRAALLADAGADNPESVPTVWDVPQNSREPREFHYRRGVPPAGSGVEVIDHWVVTGDARDWSNWRYTGTTPVDF
jgi:hypothetical protein